MKKTKLLAKLDRLDSNLMRLLNEMSKYNDEQLFQPPAEGAWSPVQVLQHLILAESGSLRYLRKKTSGGLSGIPKSNFGTWLRMQLLNLYLDLPIKFKAPKSAGAESFEPVASFAEAADKYRKIREELRSFLESLPEEAFRLEVYRHPYAGRMSLAGMLVFFDEHFNRHEGQILKQLK